MRSVLADYEKTRRWRPRSWSARAYDVRHDPLPAHHVSDYRPGKSRAFYEALGFELRRELPIVRNSELEATNYFFGMPGQHEELELTFNHDGGSYELGTGYGHIAIGVDDLDAALARLREQGIEPERGAVPRARRRLPACFVNDPDSLVSNVELAAVVYERRLNVLNGRAESVLDSGP